MSKAQAEDTRAAEDTSVSDAADTSTNEEAQDTDVENFDDVDASFEDDDDTEESEDSKEEESKSEEAEDKSTEESEEESKEGVESEDSDDVSDEGDGTAPEEEQKAHNKAMAEARIAEKDARKKAEEARQEMERARIEQYLQEARDDEVELERRNLDVEAYKIQQEKIGVNRDRLQNGLDKAVANIDLFKTGTPNVQKRLFRAVDQFEAQNVVYNDAKEPVEIKGDVYQYLQEEADSIKELLGDGALIQQKSKAGEKSRTITPPVKTPQKPKVDPDLEAFDEEANKW